MVTGSLGSGSRAAATALGSMMAMVHGALSPTSPAPSALPGDDLVRGRYQSTHALTIVTSPAEVWPRIVQLGVGRGGWYSRWRRPIRRSVDSPGLLRPPPREV